MKRIKFILFAITMLLAAPAFLTSCQEDAPEINYTMNVNVTNDFTKVVEAINNGFLKNEEATKKLTEAIDKMNADQQTKLQAIIDVLNSVNATLETKLAAIEAAMKAQTLTLESKLALLETAIKNQTIKQEEMAQKLITAINNLQGNMDTKIEAITEAINNVNTTLQSKLALIEAAIKAQTLSVEGKLDLLEAAIKAMPDYTSQLEAIKTAIANLPDYGDKLSAIEAAIKAMPDYSDKFNAVVAALNAMKTQVEALGTSQAGIATQIANVTTAINNLINEVKSGNISAAAALAQIIAKLEELKGNIGGGGGGETPGGGGDTPPIITMDYVDLGLPSGIKWAKCNLGAKEGYDYGDYYSWGELVPKPSYGWDYYKFKGHDIFHPTKYNSSDHKVFLEPEDDAATFKLGSPWRIPTRDEIKELIDYCTWTWTTINGIKVCLVKGPSGQQMFMPAAGWRDNHGHHNKNTQGLYMTNEVCPGTADAPNYANFYDLEFFKDYSPEQDICARDFGIPIRAVRP